MTSNPGSLVAGILFIVLGVTFLGDTLGWWTITVGRLWPILLIAVGATILLNAARSKGD